MEIKLNQIPNTLIGDPSKCYNCPSRRKLRFYTIEDNKYNTLSPKSIQLCKACGKLLEDQLIKP
jgi:hypothetical protein